MKTKIFAVVAAIASITFSGPVSAQANEQDAAFLNFVNDHLVRSSNPFRNSILDAGKINDGVIVCRSLDGGDSVTSFVNGWTGALMEQFTEELERTQAVQYTGAIIAGAVHVYCPEYVPSLNEFLRQY